GVVRNADGRRSRARTSACCGVAGAGRRDGGGGASRALRAWARAGARDRLLPPRRRAGARRQRFRGGAPARKPGGSLRGAGGASGEELGALGLLQAEAHRWRGETAEAEQAGLAAMQWLAPRSAAWFSAAAQVANARGLLGRYAELEQLAATLCENRASGDAAP